MVIPLRWKVLSLVTAPVLCGAYILWIRQLKHSWFNNQLIRLHPEYYQPARFRYQPSHSPHSMADQIQELVTPPIETSIRSKLLTNVSGGH